MTYLTRPTPIVWIGYVLVGILYLPALRFLVGDHEPQLDDLALPILAGAGIGLWLANHLRWQFHHPRSTLTPGFFAPHFAVWAFLAAALTVVCPAVAILGSSTSVWTVLSGFAVGMAIGQQLISVLIYVWIAAIFGGRFVDPDAVQPWIRAEGYRQPLLVAVTLFGWAAAIWRVRRLYSATEEDVRYLEPTVTDPNAEVSRTFRSARERVTAAALRRRKSTKWTVAWLDRQISRSPQWSHWRRLEIAFRERQSPVINLISVASSGGSYALLTFAADGFRWEWNGESLESFWFILAIATAVLPLIATSQLSSRLPQMSSERLLPMTNQAYADAQLRICLWAGLRPWVLLVMAAAVVVFALPWEGLDPTTLSDVAAYATISLAGFVYSFGVGAFCSSMSGCFPLVFAVATSALSTLALQNYWLSLHRDESQIAAFFWAFTFAIVGVWFVRRARLLWRHKEFAAALSHRFA